MYIFKCDGYQPKYREGEAVPLEDRAVENLKLAIRDLDYSLNTDKVKRMNAINELGRINESEKRAEAQIEMLKKAIDKLEQE